MIIGRFDEWGIPLVLGEIWIPKFQVRHEIEFLVDTGSDRTVIHPEDANDAQVPFDQLMNRAGLTGIGGVSPFFYETAFVTFNDGPDTRTYEVELLIAEPRDDNVEYPSLLGRDVINNWFMQYDPVNDSLGFMVRRIGIDYDTTS